MNLFYLFTTYNLKYWTVESFKLFLRALKNKIQNIFVEGGTASGHIVLVDALVALYYNNEFKIVLNPKILVVC